MQDGSNTPTRLPIEPMGMETHKREEQKRRASRGRTRRQDRRSALSEQQRRYDPSVLVVVEYVGSDRDELTRPIVMNITGTLYGFWKNPSPGLAPWQGYLPASHALPRVDHAPHKWKLIHDPREDAAPDAKREELVDAVAADTEELVDAVAADTEELVDAVAADTEELVLELELLEESVLTKSGAYKKTATAEDVARLEYLRGVLTID